jgi:hypothetical protein
MKTKTVYVAYTNTDRTDGRGQEVTYAICESEVTARRLAKGCYVQWSDGPVKPVELIMIDGKWYAPTSLIQIHGLSKEDREEQRRLEVERSAKARAQEAIKKAIQKAKAAGLTDEDIDALKGLITQ